MTTRRQICEKSFVDWQTYINEEKIKYDKLKVQLDEKKRVLPISVSLPKYSNDYLKLDDNFIEEVEFIKARLNDYQNGKFKNKVSLKDFYILWILSFDKTKSYEDAKCLTEELESFFLKLEDLNQKTNFAEYGQALTPDKVGYSENPTPEGVLKVQNIMAAFRDKYQLNDDDFKVLSDTAIFVGRLDRFIHDVSYLSPIDLQKLKIAKSIKEIKLLATEATDNGNDLLNEICFQFYEIKKGNKNYVDESTLSFLIELGEQLNRSLTFPTHYILTALNGFQIDSEFKLELNQLFENLSKRDSYTLSTQIDAFNQSLNSKDFLPLDEILFHNTAYLNKLVKHNLDVTSNLALEYKQYPEMDLLQMKKMIFDEGYDYNIFSDKELEALSLKGKREIQKYFYLLRKNKLKLSNNGLKAFLLFMNEAQQIQFIAKLLMKKNLVVFENNLNIMIHYYPDFMSQLDYTQLDNINIFNYIDSFIEKGNNDLKLQEMISTDFPNNFVNDNILEHPVIKFLDEYFGIMNVYNFNGILISKNRFLRNFSSLLNFYNNENSNEDEIIALDALVMGLSIEEVLIIQSTIEQKKQSIKKH